MSADLLAEITADDADDAVSDSPAVSGPLVPGTTAGSHTALDGREAAGERPQASCTAEHPIDLSTLARVYPTAADRDPIGLAGRWRLELVTDDEKLTVIRDMRPDLTVEQIRRLSPYLQAETVLKAARTEGVDRGTGVKEIEEIKEIKEIEAFKQRGEAPEESGQKAVEDLHFSRAKPPFNPSTPPLLDPSAPIYTSKRDIHQLILSYEKGDLKPSPIDLPPVPRTAPRAVHEVRANIALLIGLRRADGDDRPLMYSRSFCCQQMGWDPDLKRSMMTAHRTLHRLLEYGVVERGPDVHTDLGMCWTLVAPATDTEAT